MNREINFRAWDSSDNVMYHTIAFEDMIKIEIMQFTGLLDKNGKEIYEGDIIIFKFWNKEGVASIVFENGAFGMSEYSEFIELFCFQSFCSYDEPEKDCYPFIEVIGNIYENPELLDTKKAQLSEPIV